MQEPCRSHCLCCLDAQKTSWTDRAVHVAEMHVFDAMAVHQAQYNAMCDSMATLDLHQCLALQDFGYSLSSISKYELWQATLPS